MHSVVSTACYLLSSFRQENVIAPWPASAAPSGSRKTYTTVLIEKINGPCHLCHAKLLGWRPFWSYVFGGDGQYTVCCTYLASR
ncbi:hypothetical protein PISMIDRAFT_551540 [Pisolithus microcarpus 441]|uniref:Uncharacterized protein n=1 Tax=Pisolithus microcarpus 441 TaxID=765257 RepID=A0A0C9ZRP4_9AGAM|nr:hypothetical protein PISMIDRAFT_551540 [Pisolithus microcarpus 441]